MIFEVEIKSHRNHFYFFSSFFSFKKKIWMFLSPFPLQPWELEIEGGEIPMQNLEI